MDTKRDQQLKLRDAILNNRKSYEGNNISFEESQKTYDKIADTYEELMVAANVTCQRLTAELVAQFYLPEERSRIQVLDVGAGTGMVAKALQELGFENIDALDPNEQMLNKAKQHARYRMYYTEPIMSENSCSIKTGSYDVVTACAVFAESGQVPPESIREMARMVKPGGYIVIISRLLSEKSLDSIESVMYDIENEKKWQALSRDVWPGYNEVTSDLGISWTFKRL